MTPHTEQLLRQIGTLCAGLSDELTSDICDLAGILSAKLPETEAAEYLERLGRVVGAVK